LDIITHASARCDEVIVFIGNSDDKLGRYCFTLPERVAMAEQAIRAAKLANVRVLGSSGLLADVYLREGCDVIFRGVRTPADRSGDEAQMALHDVILPGLSRHVEYVAAKPERTLVSSTMVKAFVAHDLDVSRYVPVHVKQALEERILRRCLIGITGPIAVGKSHVTTRIAEHVQGYDDFPVTVMDLDKLQRDLYTEDSPGAQLVRDDLARLLGQDILTDGGRTVDRQRIADRIFSPACPADTRAAAHAIVAPHVERKFREAIRGTRGLVLIEWAQLLEMGCSRLVNNHVILVESPERATFAKRRGISDTRLAELREFQWSDERKRHALDTRIAADQYGRVYRFENRRGVPDGITELTDDIVAQFPFLRSMQRESP
ncbi:MAG: dephospho-CoA kinase, partial [bacterium]|nr:dephospho-CoA kinase [bacterium]